MRWLLFLSRIAFICNIFFLLSVSLQFYDWSDNHNITSTIIIIGYFMAILFNPLANICYLLLLISRKRILHSLPLWLIIANVIFLVLQLIYIIYLTSSNTLHA